MNFLKKLFRKKYYRYFIVQEIQTIRGEIIRTNGTYDFYKKIDSVEDTNLIQKILCERNVEYSSLVIIDFMLLKKLRKDC